MATITIIVTEKVDPAEFGQKSNFPLIHMSNEVFGAMVLENIRMRDVLNKLKLK